MVESEFLATNTLKRTNMKIKMIVCSALAGCVSEKCEHHDKD